TIVISAEWRLMTRSGASWPGHGIRMLGLSGAGQRAGSSSHRQKYGLKSPGSVFPKAFGGTSIDILNRSRAYGVAKRDDGFDPSGRPPSISVAQSLPPRPAWL